MKYLQMTDGVFTMSEFVVCVCTMITVRECKVYARGVLCVTVHCIAVEYKICARRDAVDCTVRAIGPDVGRVT